MAKAEGPTFFDRVLERAIYPNINGITPGPIAGQAMQAERERASKPSEHRKVSYGFVGLPNPTVSPSRPYHHRTTNTNTLGPDEGRAFGPTTREQKIMSVVGAVTVAYLTARLLKK